MTSTWADPLQNLIASEHQEVYTLYNQYVANSENDDLRKSTVEEMCWQIARHAVAEEMLIYPLFEKYLGQQGKDLADEDRREHNQVKERLLELASSSVQFGTSYFDDLVKDTVTHLKIHSDSEESQDLPMLLALLPPDEAQTALVNFTKTKLFAPISAMNHKSPFESWVVLVKSPLEEAIRAFEQLPELKGSARSVN